MWKVNKPERAMAFLKSILCNVKPGVLHYVNGSVRTLPILLCMGVRMGVFEHVCMGASNKCEHQSNSDLFIICLPKGNACKGYTTGSLLFY